MIDTEARGIQYKSSSINFLSVGSTIAAHVALDGCLDVVWREAFTAAKRTTLGHFFVILVFYMLQFADKYARIHRSVLLVNWR